MYLEGWSMYLEGWSIPGGLVNVPGRLVYVPGRLAYTWKAGLYLEGWDGPGYVGHGGQEPGGGPAHQLTLSDDLWQHPQHVRHDAHLKQKQKTILCKKFLVQKVILDNIFDV